MRPHGGRPLHQHAVLRVDGGQPPLRERQQGAPQRGRGHRGRVRGAGGDLRIGLPRQSLHDGDDWVHVPQRLSVFLEAPRTAIDAVIAKHALVRNLVDHEWLFVFAIEPGGGAIHQRTPRGWERSEHV
ncbi:MAG: DUF2309 family protein [Sandaracinaceae bacterium]|nr:DUF2309 family protein [Sandaracinaceae bacterium]